MIMEDEKTEITKEDWEQLKRSAFLNIKQSKISIMQFTELMKLADRMITESEENIEKEIEAELTAIPDEVNGE